MTMLTDTQIREIVEPLAGHAIPDSIVAHFRAVAEAAIAADRAARAELVDAPDEQHFTVELIMRAGGSRINMLLHKGQVDEARPDLLAAFVRHMYCRMIAGGAA